MEELLIEEKAKRYDSMFERLKEMYNNNKTNVAARLICERYFPELKESEGEKIRKEIISALKYANHKGVYDKHLAWLEKQGKPIDKIVERAMNEKQRVLLTETNGDANIDWNTRSLQDVKLLLEYGLDYIKKLEKQGEQKPYGQREECSDCEFRCGDKCIGSCAMKRGEQNLIDKIEPRFKIGDTVTVKPMSCHGIVFKGEPFKIVDIIEDNYVSDNGKTYSISLQDGWELVEQRPADYIERYNMPFEEAQEYISKRGFDIPWTDCDVFVDFRYITQTVANILRWADDNPKQKPADTEKGTKGNEREIPNSAWTKEDEKMYTATIFTLAAFIGNEDKIDWLKSLRTQSQWKPSDEQMNALNYVVNLMASSERPTENDLYYNILKSLRQQLKKLREK